MLYKKLHDWNISPKKAIDIQSTLKKLLKFEKIEKEISLVAGVDLSFFKEYGLAVIVVLDYDFNIREIVHHVEKVSYPYIPGLLAFREGPIFIKAWEKLKTDVDIVFFDGHGIAHPRKLGIASHMGLWIEKATIGIAKSKLIGNYKEPGKKRGNFSYLEYDGEKIGIVYRSRNNVKPIFISPGYLIDLESSLKITKSFITKYRLPEPTRLAHLYTQKIKKEHLSS
ncbi:endonuclease V [Thermosipho atlanticus]|uniref:Endonuclease V n=1 Tax=Thermosipho atlanticus DSM 15807 TaxID=1123380 RepID=A0A1M5R656_9BACT|nr:endonuclease V [Thermosipho atlanticus]SHH21530.1 Endonuclease V [Thermosipho atlanticus DSM 15807]